MSRRLPYPFAAIPATSWQPDGAELSLPERLVLGAFVDRWRQGHDVIAVGAAELVRVTGLSERACDRARTSLLDRALLVRLTTGGGRVSTGAGRAATYHLGAFAKGAARAPLIASEGGTACPVQGGTSGAQRGQQMPGLSEEIRTGAPDAPTGRVKTWQ